MSVTIRHWPKGYQHDHTAADVRTALIEALRHHGLSTTGVHLMVPLLESRGYVEFVVPGVDTYMFRVMGRRH